MAKHRAIFLDRYGVLIDEAGYIKHSSYVCFYPFTFDALSLLQEHFLLFIISNQSGIAKGITTENKVSDVNKYINKTLKEKDVVIYDVFCCPHRSEDNCECNKPKTYFIGKAHQLYNIDLSRSFVLDDPPSDDQSGLNDCILPIYILIGHGQKHLNEISKEAVICSGLLESSKYTILNNNQI